MGRKKLGLMWADVGVCVFAWHLIIQIRFSLLRVRAYNLIVVDQMMMEKAKRLAVLLGIEEFKASPGWLQNFKKRRFSLRRNAREQLSWYIWCGVSKTSCANNNWRWELQAKRCAQLSRDWSFYQVPTLCLPLHRWVYMCIRDPSTSRMSFCRAVLHRVCTHVWNSRYNKTRCIRAS